MHMYNKSEELVKELETAVQQEQNDSRKTEYQRILQTQRNLSANLKSLGDANSEQQAQQQAQQESQQHAQQQAQGQQQQAQGTQAYNAQSSSEQNMNTSQYTSDTQKEAKFIAEQEQKKKK